ncbi:MAG TPA: TIM barrel protein [Opitutaceae bacterium]|nr:TIM barrel protein [Opitutaceae bacterium]
MRLLLFRSLWTNGRSLGDAIEDVATGLFDGVEGPLPTEPADRAAFTRALHAAAIPFIAEIVTGGDYVPRTHAMDDHLADLRRGLDRASDAGASFATVLAGCDHWPLGLTVDFFGQALACARERGLPASFETHRSRPTFTPWATAEILRQLPDLTLTCDFSHWCCVCERLVLDDEPELLALFASRARHIHARVGYAQGPQVPHPAAPEYREALHAHERWWDTIIAARRKTGRNETTITPEFGPDGYLHHSPFTDQPAASLDEVNRWMADRLRARFVLREPLLSAGGAR